MEHKIYFIRRIDNGRILTSSFGLIFYTEYYKLAELQRSQLDMPDAWVVDFV